MDSTKNQQYLQWARQYLTSCFNRSNRVTCANSNPNLQEKQKDNELKYDSVLDKLFQLK